MLWEANVSSCAAAGEAVIYSILFARDVQHVLYSDVVMCG
jgi:hypothetical protein